MKKDVLISIRGTQFSEGEQPQTIELTTDGKMFHEQDSLCFSYTETEMTGMEGVVTTFCIAPDKVVLRREGQLSSTMTFIEGKTVESLYDLGFGAMLLGVRTKKVVSKMQESGGSLYVDYAVELEHVPVGSNVYEIEVRETVKS